MTGLKFEWMFVWKFCLGWRWRIKHSQRPGTSRSSARPPSTPSTGGPMRRVSRARPSRGTTVISVMTQADSGTQVDINILSWKLFFAVFVCNSWVWIFNTYKGYISDIIKDLNNWNTYIHISYDHDPFLRLRTFVPGTGFDDMSFDVSRWFAFCMPCLINYSWIYVSAAHPIVSASPTTIYSETKILAVLLLHFCWIMNILWSCSSCTNILHLSNLINIDNMCTCVHISNLTNIDNMNKRLWYNRRDFSQTEVSETISTSP